MKAELVLDVANTLGEAPVWNEGENALYWVDCSASKLFRLASDDGRVSSWDLGAYPGSYAFRTAAPGLLMAFRRGLGFVELRDDGSVVTEALEHPLIDTTSARFNDGKCDRSGRFWVGQMDRQEPRRPVGMLYRIDPDRSVQRMDGGAAAGNGIAFSPDGRTMYFIDSIPALVFAYDYDAHTGITRNKRVLADLSQPGGFRPDGCTTDEAGCLWIAHCGNGRIGRYTPDGRLDQEIELPVPKPTSVMFGGPRLDTLYVTSMWHGLTPGQRAAHPLSGGLFAVQLPTPGLAEPRFAG